MTSASSIPEHTLSSTLRVLSQNINGFQTKITMRKRKQKRIVALGSLLRSPGGGLLRHPRAPLRDGGGSSSGHAVLVKVRVWPGRTTS